MRRNIIRLAAVAAMTIAATGTAEAQRYFMRSKIAPASATATTTPPASTGPSVSCAGSGDKTWYTSVNNGVSNLTPYPTLVAAKTACDKAAFDLFKQVYAIVPSVEIACDIAESGGQFYMGVAYDDRAKLRFHGSEAASAGMQGYFCTYTK